MFGVVVFPLVVVSTATSSFLLLLLLVVVFSVATASFDFPQPIFQSCEGEIGGEREKREKLCLCFFFLGLLVVRDEPLFFGLCFEWLGGLCLRRVNRRGGGLFLDN